MEIPVSLWLEIRINYMKNVLYTYNFVQVCFSICSVCDCNFALSCNNSINWVNPLEGETKTNVFFLNQKRD